MWKYLLIFLVVYLVVMIAGHLLFNLVANARKSKKKLLERAYAENGYDPYRAEEEDGWFWQDGSAKTVAIKGASGRKLSAYLAKQPENTHRWVICFHDYGTDARYTSSYARQFYTYGYHVLAPDGRGCGASKGRLLGLGYADRVDLKAWIDYTAHLDPDAEIVLFGLGSGGAASLFCGCDKDLSPHVKGIITDSSYAGLWEAIMAHILPRAGALASVFTNFANTEYFLLNGFRHDWRKADLWNQISKCPLPLLLIHGEEDYFFPVKHFEVLSERVTSPLMTLRVPGAGHIACAHAAPEQYWSTVTRYLESLSF